MGLGRESIQTASLIRHLGKERARKDSWEEEPQALTRIRKSLPNQERLEWRLLLRRILN